MGYFLEFFGMIAACLGAFLFDSPFGFVSSGVVGVILAVLSVIGAVYFGRSFRATYRRGPLFYLTCLFVGGITFFSVPVFRALSYMRPVSEKSIQAWGLQARYDNDLQNNAFVQAFRAVEALGVEDFSNVVQPENGGNLFPTSQRESQETAAGVYVKLAMTHWREKRPFLSSLLGAQAGPGPDRIADDMDQFFAAGPRQYPVARGMDLAKNHITGQLEQKADSVVFWFRCLFTGIVLLCQAIPLGAIAYESNRQLQPVRASRRPVRS